MFPLEGAEWVSGVGTVLQALDPGQKTISMGAVVQFLETLPDN